MLVGSSFSILDKKNSFCIEYRLHHRSICLIIWQVGFNYTAHLKTVLIHIALARLSYLCASANWLLYE